MTVTATESPRLFQASALCYRLYDVADEIDLDVCHELVTKAGGAEGRRMRLGREGSEYLQLSNPPLSIELGTRPLPLADGAREVNLSARVFDHGCVSVLVRVPIADGTSLEELTPFADRLYDSQEIDRLTLEEVQRLRERLAPALQDPHLWDKNENYTVLLARRIEGGSAADLAESPALARLLIGEAKEPRLSRAETREVLKHAYSYTDDDLAVVEWNAAFVYEPSGHADIADLLEVANAQLLELRYYDHVLDLELARIYDVIGERGGGTLLFSPYQKLARELMGTLIELSEFIERIENVLKIVGDVYLARVYTAGLTQCRVPQWTEQVSRKHKLLQQTYSLLKGEVDTGRALTLETMVVGLILLEILMAFLKVSGH